MAADDEASLLEEEERYPWSHPRQHGRYYSQRAVIFIVLLLFSFGFALGILIGPYWPRRLDILCLEKTSTPSALSPEVKISYHEQRFKSTIFGKSIYRQEPSPEVDQAWIDLGTYLNVTLLDPDKALKAGITEGHVRTSEKTGGKYFANVEVFHQLHCLNLLRKTNYWNYGYYRTLGEYEFVNDDNILQAHTDHCMDALREQLMCTADIGVFPYVHVKDHARSFPDFTAVPHMCRNFEDIRSWVRENQLTTVGPDLFRDIEPGDIVLDNIP